MMKSIVLLMIFGNVAFGQFGGFGGGGRGGGGLPFGNIANVAQQPFNYLRNFVPNNFDKFTGINVKTFADFVAQTGKKYATEAEKTLREGIFKQSLEKIDKHNADFTSGKSSYELGINPFGDLKLNEFVSGMTGRRKHTERGSATTHKNQAGPPATVAVPDCFDWREKGGVTEVKFQGLECGACWSFAVTGAIEGHWFAKNGELVSLSEQNLIDCAVEDPYGNTGCDGGFQDYGFDYVLDNRGIAAETKYPYVEETGKQCLYNETIKAASITGYSMIEPGNEEKMKQIIATKGPLACSVNAGEDSFQLYKSGIYEDQKCNEGEVNHSILVVGYGTENGRDYWIIKNSWTNKWGEGGFMKLPRNANSFCGIASECSFPIV
ncbi:procathepsin L-like [Condylostylus longicornis]|uniref:procathepsin L-like n=1 Tax=Condylostylus longicornis TaxID=2530218 RepID=UPI00244E0523|nr:procathepsin L-like [Condylostylus longicornis]